MTDQMIAHTLKERDLRAHPYLWIAAKRAYERGRAEDRGSFYEFMTCIVFCAFTFEAYVNWLGWKFWDKEWNAIHERSNLETKLTVINDKIGFSFDAGQRPWQTLADIFSFRNAIAHGKAEALTETTAKGATNDSSTSGMLRSWWELYSTDTNATRVREDLEKMITQLHGAANLPGESNYPFTAGMQNTGTTFKPKETHPEALKANLRKSQTKEP